jgi:O-antigen/teichoic acid export membrane protein
MSRTQRSAWNMATGLALTGLTLITGFVGTPFILRWLGVERFGAYRVLMDWFGYLTILDLGVIGSVTARLAPKLGAGDHVGVSRVLTAGFRVYMRIALLMFAGGALLIFGLPHFMKLQSIHPAELRIAGWILLIPVAWVPLSVYRALTEAQQRGYLVNLLLSLQALLTTGLLVLFAWAGWGLTGQAVATTAGMMPITLALAWAGVSGYRGSLTAKPETVVMREVRSLNWPTFWFNMSGRLGLLSDNVVIGWILGPAAVAPFFLTQRLAQIAQVQLQAIGNATWAGLVELSAQRQTSKFCARLEELTSIVSGIGIAVLAPIAAYNRYFIELWVGPHSWAGGWVNGLACLNIWMWAITSLWGWPLSGAGHIAAWTPYAVVFMAINVAVSIVATLLFGVVGPLLGTLTAFLLIHSWAMPHVLGKVFDPQLRSLWKPALAPLMWGAPYSALIWLVARSHRPRGWTGLAAEAGAAALGGLFLWCLSLGSDQREHWYLRLQNALAWGR